MRRQRKQFGVYVRRFRSQTGMRTIRDVANPAKVARHGQRLLTGDRARSNLFTPSLSRDAEARFAASLIGSDEADVRSAFVELEADTEVLPDLKRHYESARSSPRYTSEDSRSSTRWCA